MLSRRACLQLLSTAALASAAGSEKTLAGIFPIIQTPFTNDNKLDTKTLARQLEFLDKAGVHGIVWPQLASEYADLSPQERFAGMEVVAATGKPLRPAVVLGVQANDIAQALQYTKHAEKLAPDAIIALPPREEKDRAKVVQYYRAIGDNTSRPLFAQTIGDMPVDVVLEMTRTIPHFHYIKDEAGHTLTRLSEYRRKSASGKVKAVFTGGHGKNMLDEMERGAAGTMPAGPFADLYVNVWDAWKAGDKQKALDEFAKVMLLVTQITAYGIPSIKYLYELRGVFPNHNCRSGAKGAHFDEEAKAALKATLDYVKPRLRV
jgi:4-hydroxy-tetrahydrodipicolinate synthase